MSYNINRARTEIQIIQQVEQFIENFQERFGEKPTEEEVKRWTKNRLDEQKELLFREFSESWRPIDLAAIPSYLVIPKPEPIPEFIPPPQRKKKRRTTKKKY